MNRKTIRLVVWAVTACLAGCRSKSPSQYISPRVEGRVVDSLSHAPIQGVHVHRVVAREKRQVGDAPHGGELMVAAPVVVTTRADGSFVLNSERDLTLFRTISWSSASIAFEHPNYAPFTATYSASDAVNSATGEPVVRAGDVLMTPLIK